MMLWVLYIGLVGYNILDVYHTVLLFEFGVPEANPLLLYLMRDQTDIIPIIIVKIIILGSLGIFIYIQNKKEKEKYEKLSLNI